MNKLKSFTSTKLPQIINDINDFIDVHNYKLSDYKYSKDIDTHCVVIMYDELYMPPDQSFDITEDVNP